MSDKRERQAAKEDALRIVRAQARWERERILLEDRLHGIYADEKRRTEKALEWQRSPMRVTARRTGSVLRVLYYAALVILTPLTLGAVLIPHFVIKKLFFDKKG